MILATYQMRTREVSKKLLDDIRQRFHRNEKLTITITSDERPHARNMVREFLEIEKKFPLKSVPQSLDFNKITDEINL